MYGGGSLIAEGKVSRPLVGPILNGAGFAAIADTDAGALDGDARWDSAVGPMQFIPATWQLVGRDGNGDGTADPFNIDDAALSTATYLCAHGRDLTTAEGWTNAIYAYTNQMPTSGNFVTTPVNTPRGWRRGMSPRINSALLRMEERAESFVSCWAESELSFPI
jgi:membrane-bound lytic murein transglycosylase B